MAIPLLKFVSDDATFNLFQTGLERTLKPLIQNPLSDGNVLEKIVLTSGTNQVAHKLGRKLLGWFAVRVRSNITLYDSQDTNLLQDKYLTLVASGAGTVDLFVF